MGLLPYSAISDSTRRRLKPQSWTGLSDFAEAVAPLYRLDRWQGQSAHVEFFVEKDAMVGVISPVTAHYDAHLNVIRGNASETFVYEVGKNWRHITKPIFAYYLGDHDPSGLQIEADLHKRLVKFAPTAKLSWKRVAIDGNDFRNRALLGFRIKGNRSKRAWRTKHREYLDCFGDRCVEVDALDPTIIRERVREAIETHIDQAEWVRLQEIEDQEQQLLESVLTQLSDKDGAEPAPV